MKFNLLENVWYKGFNIRVFSVKDKEYLMVRVIKNNYVLEQFFAAPNNWVKIIKKRISSVEESA